MGGLPSDQNNNDQYVGVRNPDGSTGDPDATGSDGSSTNEVIDPTFLEKEDTAGYQPNVQEIITRLERLSDLLNPIKFNPFWMNLNTELNNKLNEINSFHANIQKLYSNEYKSIAIRADMLLDRIKQALQTCKSEQQNPDADVIYTGVFTWLEKDGPALMRNLIALKEKIQQ